MSNQDESAEAPAATDEHPVVRDNTPQSGRRTAIIAVVLVAACVAVGALVDARAGTLLLAGASFGAAAVRMSLPPGTAFSVRRRAIDVALMIAFGVALAWLGLTTPLD